MFQINEEVRIVANEDTTLNGLTGIVTGFDGSDIIVVITAFHHATFLMPATAIRPIIDEDGMK